MSKTKAYLSGELGAKADVISMEILGKKGTLADDGVLTTEFTEAGLYIVSAGDDSTIVAVKSVAGTVSTELVTVNANFTVTATTDAKANVYIGYNGF